MVLHFFEHWFLLGVVGGGDESCFSQRLSNNEFLLNFFYAFLPFSIWMEGS